MVKNRISNTLLLTAVCLVSLAAAGVSSATAAPKGEYAVFSQCPIGTPELNGCFVSRTESGEIKLGNTTVPIEHPITLQGGLINRGEYEKELVGATLSKSPQKVPGGLLGIKCNEIKGEGSFEKESRKLCEKLFSEGILGVYATAELAGKPALNELALELETGVAVSLPLKFKLENALLGNECYIGSNTEPVKLELTTGTSGTLKGKKGTISSRAGGGILVIKNTTLVDSTFAAPKANGCGPFGILDGLIDTKLGLPAATGNKAILNGTEEQANSELVEESEH